MSISAAVRAYDRYRAGEVTLPEAVAVLDTLTDDEAQLLHDLVVLDARACGRPLDCDEKHE